ncbi:M20 family metallopeptidase [Flagellimonas amoyensis]|uniref:M20 family metallopeptidase n=1 Tax=Flagellimonas amoyensis TaxID=2169401 RepID=UPI000D3B135D|nr:M20 family metallopeptidase [Allomuricauda amoyensis]
MDAISLTQQLIEFNTVNPPGNEEEIARFLGEILSGHGFTVEYPKHAEHRLNLVATKGLSEEKLPIVLSGHLDVVPLGAEKWSVDPFGREIKGDKLYGRGSTDMKAGVAAMTIAAIESFEKDAPLGGVKLVFTADEELGCRGAKQLCDSGYDIGRASALIIGEPTANTPYLAHKGGLYLNAKTTGVTAHSSMPELGENAIYKAARAVTKIENLTFKAVQDDTLGFPTINVGYMQGGLNLNSVPDKAEFTIDIRSTTKLANSEAFQQLKALVGDEVSIEKLVDLNAIATPVEHPFIQLISEICGIDYRKEGTKKSAPYLTDASVLTPWLDHAPTLILGPGEPSMAHKIDEYCHVSKILEAVELYKQIILKNGKRSE